ncbi:nucleoside phosphorylase domain-containing protein [Nemania abortiva]|nr:nucleoside phosphorylase domain-containing protein [Nemania abortiva]
MSLSLPKFQIAILCALNTEYTAICNQLDQNLADCGVVIARSASDRNAYTAGVIRGHPIIVARIQDTGKSAAALTAANLSATHKGIKLCILMGICAGAPRNAENQPIFLGDVIISTHVYNSDHGRLRDTGLERYKEDIQQLSRLERGIKALVDKCSNDYDKPRIEEEVNNRVDRSMQDSKLPARYKYPGVTEDRLFRPTHPHRHWEQESKCKHCAVDVHSSCRFASGISCVELGCGKIRNALVSRMRRPGRGAVELLDSLRSENLRPSIQLHFGPLSSADHVLRSSTLRDQQNILDEVIGYEMEAAGIWDCLPTIVIKGVSDYADAHKNKEFQGYAAVTSAATVHTVLQHWHLDSEAACTSKMHAKMVRSGKYKSYYLQARNSVGRSGREQASNPSWQDGGKFFSPFRLSTYSI